MPETSYYYALYLVPLLLLVLVYSRSRSRHQQLSYGVLDEAAESGLLEPPTLHPEFNLAKCFLNKAKYVLVKIWTWCYKKTNNKSKLVNPRTSHY